VRTAEWFERAREVLLRRFARDVLARELALAPADIEMLARQALAAFADDLPAALSVAPADVGRLDVSLPVFADAALTPGDIVVEVGDGKLLSTLQVRVDGVIAEVLAEAAA
jgi:flagellar biosynthesis/type III secretory pathway protein FliH